MALIGCFLLSTSAMAGQIQYRLDTGQVTGARDTPVIPPVEGRGVVTIPEPVAEIIWPLPSGCETGEGKLEFTRVSNPAAVTVSGEGLAVRTDMAIFGTSSTLLPGCFIVGNRQTMIDLIEPVLLQKIEDFDFAVIINHINMATFAVCGASGGGANCDTARTNMDSLDAQLPSPEQLAAFTTQLVLLRTEVGAFLSAHGW